MDTGVPPPPPPPPRKEKESVRTEETFVPPTPPPPMPKVNTPDTLTPGTRKIPPPPLSGLADSPDTRESHEITSAPPPPPPPPPPPKVVVKIESKKGMPDPLPPPPKIPKGSLATLKNVQHRNSSVLPIPDGPPPPSHLSSNDDEEADRSLTNVDDVKEREPPHDLPRAMKSFVPAPETSITGEEKGSAPAIEASKIDDSEEVPVPAPPPPKPSETKRKEPEVVEVAEPIASSKTANENEVPTTKVESRPEEDSTARPEKNMTEISPSPKRIVGDAGSALDMSSLSDTSVNRSVSRRTVSAQFFVPTEYDAETDAKTLSLAKEKHDEDDAAQLETATKTEATAVDSREDVASDVDASAVDMQKNVASEMNTSTDGDSFMHPPGLDRAIEEAKRREKEDTKAASMKDLKNAFELSVSSALLDETKDSTRQHDESTLDEKTLEEEQKASDHLLAAERALVRVDAMYEKERARRKLFEEVCDEMRTTNRRLASDLHRAREYFDGLNEEVEVGTRSLSLETSLPHIIESKICELREKYLQIRRSKDILEDVAKDPRKCRRDVSAMEAQIKRFDRWNSEVTKALEAAQNEMRNRTGERSQSKKKISLKKKQQMHHLRVARDSIVTLKLQKRKRSELQQKADAVRAVKTSKQQREWQVRQRFLAEKLVAASRRERHLRERALDLRRKLQRVDQCAAELATTHRELHGGLRRIVNEALTHSELARPTEDTLAMPVQPFDRDAFRDEMNASCRQQFVDAFDETAAQVVCVRREAAECWENILRETGSDIERSYRMKLEQVERDIKCVQATKRDISSLISEHQVELKTLTGELRTKAAPLLKQRELLRKKARVRKLWRLLRTPLETQHRVLEALCFFDDGVKGSLEGACALMTRTASMLRICLKLRDYRQVVDDMHFARQTQDEANAVATSHDTLQQRLARQSLQQHWSSLRTRAAVMARGISRAVKEWELRWDRPFCEHEATSDSKNLALNGRSFLQTPWRAKELHAGQEDSTTSRRIASTSKKLSSASNAGTSSRGRSRPSPSLSGIRDFIARHRSPKARSSRDAESPEKATSWTSASGTTGDDRRWFQLPGSDRKLILPSLDEDRGDNDKSEISNSDIDAIANDSYVQSTLRDSVRMYAGLQESERSIRELSSNI